MSENDNARILELDGCELFYRRFGHGAPLLYLDGLSASAAPNDFLRGLADRFDVIVPDHPGFGKSSTPRWFNAIEDMALFYLDFLERLELERVHVAGSYLGGWIAAEVAIRDCSRLESLTLVGAAGLKLPGVPLGDPFLWTPEERVRNAFADQRFAQERLARPRREAEDDAELKDFAALAKLCWNPRIHNPYLGNWLHRVRVRALIIWGDSDRYVPLENGRALHDLIAGSQLRVFERCGHMPQYERTEEFLATIGGFLDGGRS